MTWKLEEQSIKGEVDVFVGRTVMVMRRMEGFVRRWFFCSAVVEKSPAYSGPAWSAVFDVGRM